MKTSIWNPTEESVAIAKFSTMLILAPILLLNFIVPVYVIVVFYVLTLVISAIVLLRGSLTLPIDNEEREMEKQFQNKTSMVIIGLCLPALSFLTIPINQKFFPATFSGTAFLALIILAQARLKTSNYCITSCLFILMAAGISFLFVDRFAIFILLFLTLAQYPKIISEVIKINRIRQELDA